MQLFKYSFPIAVVLTLTGPSSASAGWLVSAGISTKGDRYAQIHIQQGDVTLFLVCDQRNLETQDLYFKLFTASMAGLPAQDNDEAVLTLQFQLPGGGTHGEQIPAWYFDGGSGDQAWMGRVQADAAMLDAFGAAGEVSILNPEGTAILRLPASGPAAGAKAIREQCGVGRR